MFLGCFSNKNKRLSRRGWARAQHPCCPHGCTYDAHERKVVLAVNTHFTLLFSLSMCAASMVKTNKQTVSKRNAMQTYLPSLKL